MGRPRGLTIGQPVVSGRQCVMRERDKPAPRQRFRQQQGDGPVVEDAAGQGHGADAAAPRPGKRQIGKPFRQSKVKPAGQIGDRNACPPQFQQVQKKAAVSSSRRPPRSLMEKGTAIVTDRS